MIINIADVLTLSMVTMSATSLRFFGVANFRSALLAMSMEAPHPVKMLYKWNKEMQRSVEIDHG